MLSISVPSERAFCSSSYNSVYIRHIHIKMHTYVINVLTHRDIGRNSHQQHLNTSLFFLISFCNMSDFPMLIINELDPVITAVTCRALRTWENLLGKQASKMESALQIE